MARQEAGFCPCAREPEVRDIYQGGREDMSLLRAEGIQIGLLGLKESGIQRKVHFIYLIRKTMSFDGSICGME